MQMLTKFESKSNRVKGLSFHPKRPWILTSLHNGSVQLWDYRMGTLVERFEEHDGPVRGVAFHPTQPLFVSGGDDAKIKVWNLKTRRCMFTLTGHLDYIRTVFFHHEHPWIISASDDQTIRIWNWQSRACIAVLTGHNHYVMCAQFHPKENLVASASLDQTVRIWDISGLCKKSAGPSSSFENSMNRTNSQDVFGNTDAMVKFVLEGHDRGVNWVSFHNDLPLIVSSGDDRQVKLWRYNDAKAWEVDTCRGHFNNVSSVVFHPRQELLVSNGEDKSIRVWDMSKRTLVQTFRREHDRFWILCAHPELNLLAAGHDSGFIVFKLERERPAYSTHQNTLFYVKENQVNIYDFTKSVDTPAISFAKSNNFVSPRTLSYNPAEHAVLITTINNDNSVYELFNLPKDSSGGEPMRVEPKRGNGSSAIFIARNRFAVLDKSTQTITIRDLSNATTKTITPPTTVVDIFHAPGGNLLLATPTSVILYDMQQRQTMSEINVEAIKYVYWSTDMTTVALLNKHTITLANKDLTQKCQVHETIRIKSGVFDDTGVFLYTTLNHIKYLLPQGDNGIIRSIEHPLYLTRAKGKNIYSLDREAKPRVTTIDPTEYRFKLALINKNYDEVLHVIKHSNLVGQSVIAYLQKIGYPEIALHFVQDERTRFELALECGNLDVALETAKVLDKEECWNRLSHEALKHGNQQIVEMAYQRVKNYDRLSFLYLATGNTDKLAKMMKIAEHRNDQMSRFQNALYLGDIQERIQMLIEVDQYPLAYLTAKSHGLEEQANQILAGAGLSPEDITETPPSGKLLQPAVPVINKSDTNWPVLSISKSPFESAFASLANADQVDANVEIGETNDGWGDDDGLIGSTEQLHIGEYDEIVEGSGWDLDADLTLDTDATDLLNGGNPAEFVMPSSGLSEFELWCKNSQLVADHVAAGSFDSAMELMHTQIGAINFAPLKSQFLTIYQASRTSLSCNPSLPSVSVPVRRNEEETQLSKVHPIVIYNMEYLLALLRDAYKATSAGKFPEAIELFRSLLHSLAFVVVSEPSEAEEIKKMIGFCREYLLGLTMEKERRELSLDEPENVKRALELAAYFTHCELEPIHSQLSLRSAMTLSFKTKNCLSASMFARRLLELAPPPQIATQARKVQTISDQTSRDEIPIDYDQYNSFTICAHSYTPIYQNSPAAQCPYCKASYKPEYNGKLCSVCEISQIGASTIGLKLI
ncbi:coatomer protein alpha subunit [Basidiobolus meristosporus CBS 931.73]|uniref:Coatomer subunit alpha n=1 Tax=Basidiobolus meristosporus CBS 931.73 TaxID=1314790 RepID=A0A1Y1Y4N4_9FUNG|nr:coatomer protein alpha subunit [Basidiobolus meristosporus CBS 931.73]|eukprot:ORX92865.1 coatomer protein alpha subunit [Basidiobolus meristosporus CBS 931.73]